MNKTKKRWGKKKKYKRNWKQYNEELVKRGTFYLDFTWVKSWNTELKEMNEKKVGAPYRFPESMIQLQAIWLLLTDLRSVVGITRKVFEMGQIKDFNHFSTISRRVNAMSTELKLPKDKNLYVATDMTGMKMNMSGEYFETKYGDGFKKFIKVTISANPFTKEIYKCDVSLEGEELSEPEVAMTHIAELEAERYNVIKFWGDGAYDTHDLFDILDQYNIKSAVKIRKNAVVDPGGGSVRRSIEVKKYKMLGYQKWAIKQQYGMRWTGTEGIFSSIKLKFGEKTRTKKEENMIKEAKRKIWAYETIRKYAQA
jgi:hypothetical protein